MLWFKSNGNRVPPSVERAALWRGKERKAIRCASRVKTQKAPRN